MSVGLISRTTISLSPWCGFRAALRLIKVSLWAAVHGEDARLTVENDGSGIPCGRRADLSLIEMTDIGVSEAVCINCGLGFIDTDQRTRSSYFGNDRYRHTVPDCKEVARRAGGEDMRSAALLLVMGEVGVLYDHDFGVIALLEEAFPEYFPDPADQIVANMAANAELPSVT